MNSYFVVEPCVTAGGFEIKFKDKDLDLKKAANALTRIGEVIGESQIVMLVKVDHYSLSVYASGKILVKSKQEIKAKDVTELANRLTKLLEKESALL